MIWKNVLAKKQPKTRARKWNTSMKVRQPLKMFIIVVGDCVSIGFVIFIAKTKLLQ